MRLGWRTFRVDIWKLTTQELRLLMKYARNSCFFYVAVTCKTTGGQNKYGHIGAITINPPELSINDEARNDAHIARTAQLCTVWLYIAHNWRCHTGPSPGFRSKGAKNRKGRPHFQNTMLDVCSNRGAKHEMGGTDFKWGPGTTASPAGDGPVATSKNETRN